MANQVIEFELKDMAGLKSPARKGKLEILAGGAGILVQIDGYGDKCSPDGKGTPIVIENFEGEARVIVWADIDQEDSTHRISLENAREENRKDT